MTGVEVILVTAIAFLGFAFSALFSGLETGLYTLNRIRLDVRADQGDPSAIALRNHLRRPVRTLVVLLLGTNAASYVGAYGVANLVASTQIAIRNKSVALGATMLPVFAVLHLTYGLGSFWGIVRAVAHRVYPRDPS